MKLLRRLIPAAVVLSAALASLAADGDADEKALRAAGVGTDGPALLEYFRGRAAAGVTPDKIAALIKQLGDDSFDERERASAQLVAIGERAEAQLREAVKNPPEAEVKARAEQCLA